MAWPSFILSIGGKLKDDYARLNNYFTSMKSTYDSHISGTTDKHDAEKITYSGIVSGGSVKEALGNIDNRINMHVDGVAEKHTSEKITYNGTAGGNEVKTALDSLKSDIENLSFTGSSHDPLVTASLVDIDGQDFGPLGLASYLDGRLAKWEKKHPIISIDQPSTQPDGGVWYEELSSDAIEESGLFIQNMIVQVDEPQDNTVLWGDA